MTLSTFSRFIRLFRCHNDVISASFLCTRYFDAATRHDDVIDGCHGCAHSCEERILWHRFTALGRHIIWWRHSSCVWAGAWRKCDVDENCESVLWVYHICRVVNGRLRFLNFLWKTLRKLNGLFRKSKYAWPKNSINPKTLKSRLYSLIKIIVRSFSHIVNPCWSSG